jgi:excisionase family DNA binding protein
MVRLAHRLQYTGCMEQTTDLTVGEAARELGLSVRAVQRRLEHGLLSGRNVGGRVWLIPREEVERAKVAGRLRPGPKPAERVSHIAQ